MHLPTGISNFRELITYKDSNGDGYLYVDKTAFIKELTDNTAKVKIIIRPRRFGKTLNLSMLQYFYAAEVAGQTTKGLFDGLEISKYPYCMQHQGKYPVIFISFKDVKQPTFEFCLDKIRSVVAATYRRHRKVFESKNISEDNKEYIKSVLNTTISQVKLEEAIQRLMELLREHYNESPILLIDEYDTPIQEAYLQGYYDQLIQFLRNFLSGSLKDEDLLKNAILTGILRVAKESLFSGLSNVKIHSILGDKYSKHFGFTKAEVNNLLIKAKLPASVAQTKEWYNGYNFGGVTIYNPFSIIEFIAEQGRLSSYWVNTSGNDIVRDLIINSSYRTQEKIQALITGETIQEYVDEHIVFSDLNKNPSAIWSLLLMSGYLKYTANEEKGMRFLCDLRIPNKEVEDYYTTVIEDWLIGDRDLNWYKELLDNLVNGNVAEFEEKLQILIEDTLSCRDVTKSSQESFYHGLMLGLVVGLKETHDVKSNKESGKGFYDVAIIPKDRNKLGIVMEFKAPQKKGKQEINLEKESKLALKQIKRSNYISELKQRGITKICKMGIAFAKKAVKIHHEVI